MAEFPFELLMTIVSPPEKTIPLYELRLLESSPSPRAKTYTLPPRMDIPVPLVAVALKPSSEDVTETAPLATLMLVPSNPS
jgi:hypothetical protein